MLKYPLTIEKDGDLLLVTSPDFPEVVTDGADMNEAIANGTDAIEEAIAGRLSDFEDVPLPSKGDVCSSAISLNLTLKAGLHEILKSRGMTRAELARKLGWHRNQVDRLFDPLHRTRLDQFEAAFDALGAEAHVTIELRDAA